MNVQKEARRDAAEYARAQMAYGEGAGTRRKLISATVEGKAFRNPAYGRLFNQELARQDMAEHAAKARKERERADRGQAINKNVRGLATGNYQSLSTGVAVVAAAGWLAHETGYDKVIKEKVQTLYYKAKYKWQARKAVKDILNEHR